LRVKRKVYLTIYSIKKYNW